MLRSIIASGLCGFFLVSTAATRAEDAKEQTVEEIAARARDSVVIITSSGRDARGQGLGSGFIVSADGLIATNLHVIGEARPIEVRLASGKRCDVIAIHAFDRAQDLAILRVDAKGLKPLELGDSDQVKQGLSVVAFGNPRGLVHSVVAGVVSGTREVDGRAMLQIALPIEQGNSGGPLLDRTGRVVGIPTIKSLVTANLGFAVPINSLKPLLKKPNPIPLSSWLTIGALDAAEWKPLLGGSWRQRAGRILAEGAGGGFGGRSLCLSQRPVPALPFEVAVTVKLDDESGAAGLVFHADGGDRHYGFYPSAGQMRLTRFEGPDVYSWKVLEQKPSAAYRPGDWNTLKVRVEKASIRCFVNDQLAIESADSGLTAGQVGLAKFRETRPMFKNFQVDRQVSSAEVGADVAARIVKSLSALPAGETPPSDLVRNFQKDSQVAPRVLRERALVLDRQASQLRELARLVHQRTVQDELVRLLTPSEDDVNLIRAALLIARLDNDEVDVTAYQKEIDRLGRELARTVKLDAPDTTKLEALNRFLFAGRGYHGSRGDYYNRSNSYLNEVIDDREGIPITLSVLYMELARHIGVKLVGVGLPGHFVVKHVSAKGEETLIDVFEGGASMSREEAARRVLASAGEPLTEQHLAGVSKRAILQRMLQNLLGLARDARDLPGMRSYLDTIVAIAPEAGAERWLRAMVHYQLGNKSDALADVDWLLAKRPEGMDLERVRELRKILTRP